MSLLKKLLAALVGLLVISSSAAAPLDFGHVAPGAGAIEVTINGEVIATDMTYREFQRVDIAGNGAHVRIRRRSDGEVLFDDHFGFRRDAFGAPLVVFFGNGQDRPFTAMAYVDGFGLVSPGASHSTLIRPFMPSRTKYRINGMNLAPAVASLPFGPRSTAYCKSVRGPGFAFERGYNVFRGYAQGESYLLLGTTVVDLDSAQTRSSEQQCRWRVIGDQPRIEVQTPPRLMQGHSHHFMLIGDGRSEPLEIIAVVDAQVIATSGPATPTGNQRAAASRHLWIDEARQGHSVSLFEMGAGRLTLGTWQSFAADGRPVWLQIEGVTTAVPGRRDVILRRVRSANGAATTEDVGSGVLLYLDCNHAELRVALADGDRRTLRLRRSRTVSSCGSILQ